MGKRRFLPNERCLGGALELNATYSNYLRKTHVSRQQVRMPGLLITRSPRNIWHKPVLTSWGCTDMMTTGNIK